MKLKFFFWMLFLPTVLGITACSDDDKDTPSTPEEDIADYTIIFYGYGGGDLDYFILNNIEQFYDAKSNGNQNVKVAVQYKFSTAKNQERTYKALRKYLASSGDTEDFDKLTSKLVLKGGNAYRFVVDSAQEFIDQLDSFEPYGNNVDMTNPNELTNFINWAAEACPAKNYILLLSDHGGGYRPDHDCLQIKSNTRGVIYKEGNSEKCLTVKSLASAVSTASIRPKVLYLDACLMNTIEYQYELKDLCDYLILSTFSVPGWGGDYETLIKELAKGGEIESRLANFCKGSIDKLDEIEQNDDRSYNYYDMTVTRTSAIESFGMKWREFTDRLIDAYQNGGAEVKAAIDEVTRTKTFLVEDVTPGYELGSYFSAICEAAPTYFPALFSNEVANAFNAGIVYQQSSRFLHENGWDVDCSIMLGTQGHYRIYWSEEMYDGSVRLVGYEVYYPGGAYELYDYDDDSYAIAEGSWSSTLADTYEQLAFDKATGWSRWIKINEVEPKSESPVSLDFNVFDALTDED